MKLSIIVITWNQKQSLIKCLKSLFEKCDLSDSEIIIIDNNSTDGTKEFLSSEYANRRLIFNNGNLGVAKARNQGIKMAQGEYILLLDDDTIVLDDFILKATQYLDENSDVFLLGPKLFLDNGEVQPSARKFPTIQGIFGRAFPRLTPESFSNSYLYSYIYSKEPVLVDWVIGACQFIRTSALSKIGLLDEKYFFGYEDIDFCYRLSKENFKIVYHPNISLIHSYQRKSAQKFRTKMKVYHFLSIVRYFYKFGIKIK